MKHMKLQVHLRTLLSLCTAILVFVSMIPVTTTAGTETNYYNATLATISNPNSNAGKTGTPVSDDDTALTPTVPSDWAKWIWTDLDTHNATMGAQCTLALTGLTQSDDGALLFYVKMPANASATQMGVRIQNLTGNRDMNAGASVYLLEKDGEAWAEMPTTKATETVAGGTMKEVGYFNIPAAFEGWVRVPFANTALEAGVALKTLRLFLLNVDEKYTQDYFCVGAVSLVDNAFSNLMELSINNSKELFPLSLAEPELIDCYKALSATANGFGTNKGSAASVQNRYDFTLTGTFFSPMADWTWDDATIKTHTSKKYIYAVLSDDYTMRSDGGLLFYVKLPENAPETTIGFRFSDEYKKNGTSHLFVTLKADTTVSLMSKANQSWQTTPVAAVEGNTAVNGVTFPAGFEGWVRIPYSSFDLEAQKWNSIDFFHVYMYPETVDTSFKDGLSVGAFTVLENGTNDYSKILINDNNTPVRLFPRSYVQESVDSVIGEKTFDTLTADDGVLMNNPDRGFRSEEKYELTEAEIARVDAMTDAQLQAEIKHETQLNTRGESPTVSRVYFKMQQYADASDIPDAALNYMNRIMAAYKAVGVRAYVTIYYMSDPTPEKPEIAPTFDTIYAHLAQYKSFFTTSKDAIAAVCFALIGEDGEWDYEGDSWSPHNNPPDDVKAEFQRIVTKMLTDTLPSDMYVTLRLPLYKQLYVENLLEQGLITQDRFNRVGFDEAAMFGLEKGNGGWNPGNSQWIYGMQQAPYAYNDAETFVTKWFHNTNNTKDPFFVGKSALESLSQQWTATLSAYHTNADYGTYEDTLFYYWKNDSKMRITPAQLTKLGLPYTPNWFTDENGNPVTRSVYDYLRDYLGYRLSFKNLSVTGNKDDGGTINVSAVLNNYGYAAPVTMTQSGFAILDEDGNVVTSTAAGTPATWYATNPADYTNRALLDHSVNAKMMLPTKAGTYRLAFYLKNSAGQSVRFDNATPYENGYMILHTFEVEQEEHYTATEATLTTPDSSAIATSTLQDDVNGLTPFVPTQWVKIMWEDTEKHNSTRTAQNPVKMNVQLAADGALLFYVKLPTKAPETKIGFKFYENKGGVKTTLLLDVDKPVSLLSIKGETWTPTTTVAAPTGRESTGYISFPAGFEGWVRIPCSSIANFPDTGLTMSILRVYIAAVDDSFKSEGVSIGGAHAITEGNVDFYHLSSDGTKILPLFYTVKAPTGITMDQVFFNGKETNVNVTLANGISAYNGNKLYYQYTPAGATEPVKMLLERVGAGTHGGSGNTTKFVIPQLANADGEIVQGAYDEPVTPLGTSLKYFENGETMFEDKDGNEMFALRFSCRAARQIEENGTTYTLKNMAVLVKGSGEYTPYWIQRTLADVCEDYVDYHKVLTGKIGTHEEKVYTLKARCIYVDAEGNELTKDSVEAVQSKSYKDLLEL